MSSHVVIRHLLLLFVPPRTVIAEAISLKLSPAVSGIIMVGAVKFPSGTYLRSIRVEVFLTAVSDNKIE